MHAESRFVYFLSQRPLLASCTHARAPRKRAVVIRRIRPFLFSAQYRLQHEQAQIPVTKQHVWLQLGAYRRLCLDALMTANSNFFTSSWLFLRSISNSPCTSSEWHKLPFAGNSNMSRMYWSGAGAWAHCCTSHLSGGSRREEPCAVPDGLVFVNAHVLVLRHSNHSC